MLDNKNMIDLFGALKEMSSERISQLIQEETSKDSPNDDLVLMALDILEDREKENPIELGSKGKSAWKKYQSKVRSRDRKTALIWRPLIQVASVLVAVTLLFALLPTQANAETWWERLARWTDDFFSFFNPNESEKQEDEYVFQTDNEGLQQIYDAVVELGLNEPVVPMWLPTGYEMVNLIIDKIPKQYFVVSNFTIGDKQVIFHIRIYDEERPYQYYKDDDTIKTYEQAGIVHYIMRNNERYTVTWTIDKVECALSIDCQEDTLFKIIDSIYRWRIRNEKIE